MSRSFAYCPSLGGGSGEEELDAYIFIYIEYIYTYIYIFIFLDAARGWRGRRGRGTEIAVGLELRPAAKVTQGQLWGTTLASLVYFLSRACIGGTENQSGAFTWHPDSVTFVAHNVIIVCVSATAGWAKGH